MIGQPGLLLYGTSHDLAPMEIREQMALDSGRMPEYYDRLRAMEGISEVLILNTCNRVEVYAAGTLGGPIPLRAELAQMTGVKPSDWEMVERCLTDRKAIQHCLKVTAGLDSQIVGETEIFGQVKKAYQEATNHEAAGPVIHRLFQHSFRVGKWVRTHTALGRGQVSTPTVAASLAGRIFGDLKEAECLVIGSGEMGEATLKVLMSKGVATPSFTGRNRGRIAELAQIYEADMVAYEHWKEKIHHFDILITSTRSDDWILERKDVEAAVARRQGRPLFMIDLAMPRDIEPDAAKVPGVYLYNLDDLAEVANENLEARRTEIERGMLYVTREAEDLWEKLSGDQAVTSSG